MTFSNYQSHWVVADRAPQEHFDCLPDLDRLITQILYNRAYRTEEAVQAFLDDTPVLYDPFLLADMSSAVQCIGNHLRSGQKIVVYGDYDADGATSTALLTQALRMLAAGFHDPMQVTSQIQAYIPDRFAEGYGLNTEAIQYLANAGTSLIVTVDCGIRGADEIRLGNELGLEFVVTDHHQLPRDASGLDVLPPAAAVVNPRRQDCAYPFKGLAGVGVAFKLAQALSLGLKQDMVRDTSLKAADLLDLVALGTVADLMPLVDENRTLVRLGLRELNKRRRPGLQQLCQQAGLNGEIDAEAIGFGLGPRLNAAGRLDHAQLACELLLTTDNNVAVQKATQLDSLNQQRQQLTRQYALQAEQQIATGSPPTDIYVVVDPAFEEGVVGLVASRLTERLYRPVLVAQQKDGLTKGSARTIPEFNITNALDECSDLLVKYGGHAMAAGFTLVNQNLPEFRARLAAIAQRELGHQTLQPTLDIDAELNLRGVTDPLIQRVLALEPFGEGNPLPKFVSYRLQIRDLQWVGRDRQHLRLTLFDGKQLWSAIGFRLAGKAPNLRSGDRVDVVYTLGFNTWQGQQRRQLKIIDIRCSTID